ncbi:acetate/propionate family kinase [Marinobacterium weihaiense]|uniref:Acetate kinase n=1 Tax=Marinobacterium weihaiense TaxID=2851016 RepID=A0ABS6MB65_9GAMM|nr:acetate/propionate family kinase [Marinobacterium weihaiense]MBV0933524.1 acetate/propionate family kinase [Marinobacterium weihaiense]
MDTILTVNGGSSSLKCGLYAVQDGQAGSQLHCLIHLKVENLLGNPTLFKVRDEQNQVLDAHELDCSGIPQEERHQFALQEVLQWVDTHLPESHLIATGHRVVHGGDLFSAPTLLDDASLAQLQRFIPLAPLHQPYNLKLVEACRALAPALPIVACFDTMFHAAQPRLERLYALPRRLVDKGVHRYGFHGLSYEYIQRQLTLAGAGALKTVACHLGAGASMCAIANGQSIASSMGFTAVEGLPMGSRTGNLDPGVLLYLMREENMDVDALEKLLYKESGWLGISGISSDMKTLHQADDARAEEAIDLFCYRIALEMGRLTAALEGVEQVVFSGGVGENDTDVRARVLQRCGWLGIRFDAEANRRNAGIISTPDSTVTVRVIPTNEEAMIATHVTELLH